MKSELFIREIRALATVLNRAIVPIALCGLANFAFRQLYNEAYWVVSEYTDWFCEVMADWHLYSALFCLLTIVGIAILNIYAKMIPSNDEIIIVTKKH